MTAVVLGASYTPSRAMLISGDNMTLDFSLNCSGGPSTVKFYLQFSEDTITWYDEVAEEDAGAGVVSMPKVVRTLADNGGTTIANNVAFNVSCQFTRRAQFGRVQMAVTAGACTVTSLIAPFAASAV